jgi:FkbM family methyltransferase
MNHKVVSVEANPVHSQYLHDSLKQNGFTDIIHHEVFVGDRKTEVEFDGWSGYAEMIDGHSTTKVQCVRTDSICQSAIFTKIDVEGSEPHVLEGMRPLLAESNAFPYIMFEITYIVKNIVDQSQVTMLNKLVADGYDLYEIQPFKLLPIYSITDKVKVWEHEYFHIHKKFNPDISNGGTNLLAVKRNYTLPFKKFTWGYSLE